MMRPFHMIVVLRAQCRLSRRCCSAGMRYSGASLGVAGEEYPVQEMRAGNSDAMPGRAFDSCPAGQGLRCFARFCLLPVLQLHLTPSLVFSTTIPVVRKVSFLFPLFLFRVPRTQFGLSLVHFPRRRLAISRSIFLCVFCLRVAALSVCVSSPFESTKPDQPTPYPLSSLQLLFSRRTLRIPLFPRLAGYSLSSIEESKALVCYQRVLFPTEFLLPCNSTAPDESRPLSQFLCRSWSGNSALRLHYSIQNKSIPAERRAERRR
jgi:hypothetical protein